MGARRDQLWQLGYTLAYWCLWAYRFVLRPKGRGVQVAIWHRGRLLLVRTSYRPQLCIPGGGARRNESYLDCAIREMHEEIGITLAPETMKSVGVYSGRGSLRNVTARLYEVELDADPELEIDRREIVWAGFEDPATLLSQDLWPGLRQYLERKTGAAAPPRCEGEPRETGRSAV